MSNTLVKYLQLKKQKEVLQETMERMEANPNFQKDKEFSEKLDDLLTEYGKTANETVYILKPEGLAEETLSAPQPRRRSRKLYRNPHTGEECKTAGSNHNTLKKWRKEHPDQDFSEWIVEDNV